MLIGIDGNEANIPNRVGVNHYVFKLLQNLKLLQDKSEINHRFIVYLKNKPLSDMPKETQGFKYKIIEGDKLWILRKLTPYLIINPDKLDLFFSPSHYVPVFSSIPRICSIMDLGYLEFSEHFKKSDFWQLKLWSAYSIYISKAVIAISNSTKNEIVRHYHFAANKIYVTHLSYDTEIVDHKVIIEDVRRIKNKYSIVGDYILYIGTLKPSKNIEGLVKAFKILSTQYNLPNTIRLVIAGKKGWLYDSVFRLINQLELQDRVIFTDFVSEEDKTILLKAARVFALPSFWEGFGIDALNAIGAGIPVVVSNRGSLPEVVGEAGTLVNPLSAQSIAEGLNKVLSLGDLEYNRLVEKGRKQAQKFSWKKTAEKTIEILEKINK